MASRISNILLTVVQHLQFLIELHYHFSLKKRGKESHCFAYEKDTMKQFDITNIIFIISREKRWFFLCLIFSRFVLFIVDKN